MPNLLRENTGQRKHVFCHILSSRMCTKLQIYRSSRPVVFCKKGLLKNFAKFTGKHLCQSLFFNKVAGLRPASLLKKRLWHRCFPVNFAEFLRTAFFTEHVRWLLMDLFILTTETLNEKLNFLCSRNNLEKIFKFVTVK